MHWKYWLLILEQLNMQTNELWVQKHPLVKKTWSFSYYIS